MNIALIPAREGSKRIPLKNIKNFCGRPLLYWICRAVQNSKLIDKGYVSTESKIFRKIIESFNFNKIEVIDRDLATCTDDASSQSVIEDFIKRINYNFNILCLLQAPCPFFQDIDNALNNFILSKKDSQLSVIRLKRFFWYDYGYPKNYKIYERPRTQELEGELIEIGNCYITTKKNLIKNKNFLGGNIGLYELPEYHFFELDTELDWTIMESINERLNLL